MNSNGSNQRVSVYCLTTEDWFPSYELRTVFGSANGIETPRLVEVTLQKRYRDYPFRITVSGADDYMMVLDSQDEAKIRNAYLEVIAMPYVTRESLKKLGFEVF